jgi:hypothetical protein
MPVDEAADCLLELRRRVRSPAVEYKANVLLRPRHRGALEWLLGPGGPVQGYANVYMVDKAYLLLLAFVDRFPRVAEVAGPEEVASAVYRASRAPSWGPFLGVLNDLMRWGPVGEAASTDELVERADAVRSVEPPGPARDVLDLVGRHRPSLEALRTTSPPDPTLALALDQQVPAILRAVDRWGADGTPVVVVHDLLKTLTDERIAEIAALRDGSRPGGVLRSMRLAGPRDDPRIQVADLVVGVVRKYAEDELAGSANPALTALLRDHVDPLSLWCDERSWSRLRPV